MAASSTVFMFSGQGSQYFQMGRELFEKNDIFRNCMTRLDDVARRFSGSSVIDILYSDARGKGDRFDRTAQTNPAIFMVEYSLAQALIESGVQPDMVLGVSMGSFAAAAVAGFLDVEDALTATIEQATTLEQWCEPGGMTAVLADPALFAEDFLRDHSELAAVNFSFHFVVTARRSELAELEAGLGERKVGYQRLPVLLPFHSRWMDEAKAPFGTFMRSIQGAPGRLPLVCCDQTATLSELSDTYFWDVVRHPIRFRETIARLEQAGASRFIDVGPAGTLATFLKYGLPATTASTVHTILTPYGVDQRNLAAVAAAVGH
ncbi:MAG TPA: acyltransferase domain-containing protein [Thermoanaerobaculia bacterium]|nr:acyltransferase domain-containing protein [Thermoanaerobaculia bacterium]